MTPNEVLLSLLLAPPTAWLAACAGKVFFLPYRCARFTCWRRQHSLTRLCHRHLDRMARTR